MAIAINRELVGNINDPSDELLNYCLGIHQRQLERFERLSDYYDGKQNITQRTTDNVNRPNEKIMVNHAKYVVDMNVGFMMTNPVSYLSEKGDATLKPILEEYDRVDIISHDTELEKDLSTFGVGYELIYLKQSEENPKQTETAIKVIDPRGVFLVTDDTIDKTPLFAVHYQPRYNLRGGIDYYLVKYYTSEWVIEYKAESLALGGFEYMKATPHYFLSVPVIEYRNNEEKQGDFEQGISIMDAYNLLQSDRINDKEAFLDAILFIQGFTLDDGDGEKLAKEKLLQTTDTDVKAEWLTKSLDESNVELLRKSLLEDFHKTTYVPDMNDEKFSGNVSGEAMKYKLFGLLQLMSVKSRYMVKGLRQRLKMFANMSGVKGTQIDVTGVKIKLKPNLPINTSDIIDQITKAIDILPLETLLSWLPDIDDPKEEIIKLTKQKEEAVELNQKVLGTMNDNSHGDLDEGGEADDNSTIQKEGETD